MTKGMTGAMPFKSSDVRLELVLKSELKLP